jgi:murein DD-endopeptidase MepM/ murein hydrolase activator NlpD
MQAAALLIVLLFAAMVSRTPGNSGAWAEAHAPASPAFSAAPDTHNAVAPVAEPATRPSHGVAYRRSTLVDAALAELRARRLRLPISFLTFNDLRDSFHHPRGGGSRQHLAVDIAAPRGTPILSVDDGVVLDLKTEGQGGIALVAADPDRVFIYYYAHLQEYHPSIQPGRPLARGDTIGFVGTSGNAPEHLPHLHFAIWRSSNLARWSSGTPINPVAVWRPERRAEEIPK